MRNLPRTHSRTEIAAGVLNDVAALHPLISPVPNIVGPAYGAPMCDRAILVIRAVEHLLTGLELALPIAVADAADTSWKRHHAAPHAARGALRERAGEPPFAQDDIPHGARGWRFPHLTPAEHVILGTDLKRLHAGLIAAEVTLANTFGARHNLRTRAAKAIRILLRLRSRLDTIAAQDCPEGVSGHPAAAIYFGAVVGMGGIGGMFQDLPVNCHRYDIET